MLTFLLFFQSTFLVPCESWHCGPRNRSMFCMAALKMTSLLLPIAAVMTLKINCDSICWFLKYVTDTRDTTVNTVGNNSCLLEAYILLRLGEGKWVGEPFKVSRGWCTLKRTRKPPTTSHPHALPYASFLLGKTTTTKAHSKNLHTEFIPFTKTDSKWIIDLNAKCKIMKLFKITLEKI